MGIETRSTMKKQKNRKRRKTKPIGLRFLLSAQRSCWTLKFKVSGKNGDVSSETHQIGGSPSFALSIILGFLQNAQGKVKEGQWISDLEIFELDEETSAQRTFVIRPDITTRAFSRIRHPADAICRA